MTRITSQRHVLRGVFVLFFVLQMLFLATFAYSYSGALTVCLMANPAPTIDGIVNEKEWGEGIYLDKSCTLKGEKNYNGFGNCYKPEFIDDERDCSGTLYILWDKTALYLAVKITDDDLYFDADEVWKNDCTEWRFNPDGDPDDKYIGMWITPEFGGNKPGWMVQNDDAGLPSTKDALPSLKATIHKDGYEWELKVPATEEVMEGIDLEVGNVMGFTISIGENDKAGADYSMPCWSLNPDTWGWNEAFWGEIEFSTESVAVQPSGKLAATWSSIKRQ